MCSVSCMFPTRGPQWNSCRMMPRNLPVNCEVISVSPTLTMTDPPSSAWNYWCRRSRYWQTWLTVLSQQHTFPFNARCFSLVSLLLQLMLQCLNGWCSWDMLRISCRSSGELKFFTLSKQVQLSSKPSTILHEEKTNEDSRKDRPTYLTYR